MPGRTPPFPLTDLPVSRDRVTPRQRGDPTLARREDRLPDAAVSGPEEMNPVPHPVTGLLSDTEVMPSSIAPEMPRYNAPRHTDTRWWRSLIAPASTFTA